MWGGGVEQSWGRRSLDLSEVPPVFFLPAHEEEEPRAVESSLPWGASPMIWFVMKARFEKKRVAVNEEFLRANAEAVRRLEACKTDNAAFSFLHTMGKNIKGVRVAHHQPASAATQGRKTVRKKRKRNLAAAVEMNVPTSKKH
jgi:hypothetical protein